MQQGGGGGGGGEGVGGSPVGSAPKGLQAVVLVVFSHWNKRHQKSSLWLFLKQFLVTNYSYTGTCFLEVYQVLFKNMSTGVSGWLSQISV